MLEPETASHCNCAHCFGHRCATILTQLQRQAAVAEAGTLEGGGHPDLNCFAERNGPSFGSMTALAKQVCTGCIV
jgi:hypothetical protein